MEVLGIVVLGFNVGTKSVIIALVALVIITGAWFLLTRFRLNDQIRALLSDPDLAQYAFIVALIALVSFVAASYVH